MVTNGLDRAKVQSLRKEMQYFFTTNKSPLAQNIRKSHKRLLKSHSRIKRAFQIGFLNLITYNTNLRWLRNQYVSAFWAAHWAPTFCHAWEP